MKMTALRCAWALLSITTVGTAPPAINAAILIEKTRFGDEVIH
jgi:hypothetical protein